MSNATVSSQVYVIRNHSSLAAVSSGTMIVYANGTHVFAKDANGNTYNLCTPSVSNIAISLNDLDDVVISNLTTVANNRLHILRYDVSTSMWINEDAVINLNDLADVSVANPTANHYLKWDGSAWVAAAVSGGSGITALYDASDVIDYNAGTAPLNGQALVWATNQWVPTNVVQSFIVSDGTNTTQIDNGETLTLSGTAPIAVNHTSGTNSFVLSFSGALTDLSDTSSTFSGLASGQVLRYSGSAFSNAALSVFDLSEVDQNSVTLSASAGAGKVLAWDQTAEAFVPVDQSSGGGATTFAALTDTASAIGAEHAVVHVTGSGGTTVDFSEFRIDNNGGSPLLYASTVSSGSIGKASSHMQSVFTKNVYLTGGTTALTGVSDFASITIDANAQNRMIFTSLVNSGIHYYDFEDSGDSSSVQLALHGNGHKFTLKTDSNQSEQLYKLPTSMGANGQVLALSGVSANQADLDWTDVVPATPLLAEKHLFVPTIINISAGSGSVALSSAYMPPFPSYLSAVYLDSAPASDSSIAITASPSFQVRPTMNVISSASAGTLRFKLGSSLGSPGSFQVQLRGVVQTANGSYNGVQTTNLQFAVGSSDTLATVSINNTELLKLMPATIMSANSQANSDFFKWHVTISINTFSGAFITVANQDLFIEAFSLPVKQ